MSEDLDLARARQRTMARVAAPTGKAYHGGATTGNGEPCPTPGHAKMIVLASGTQWCPDQSHDKEKVIHA